MNYEKEYIVENAKIVEFIKNKYGLFNVDNFIKFFKDDFYSRRLNLDDNAIKKILVELDKLLEFQHLSYTDLVYLGGGQSFGVIQVGDAVVKIGKAIDYGDEYYRLPPVYENDLGNGIALYVSQMANGKKVTEEEMLDFYQMIKKSGSIWVDPKENNLGYVDHFLNFQKLYGIDYDVNYEGPFLIDYEDIITVDDENKKDLVNWYGTLDDRKYLINEKDKWSFYYKLFVRKRNNLLEVEKKIAMRKGDFETAYQLEIQQRKNTDGNMDFYNPNYYSGDKVNYPMSKELEKSERKYRVVSAFRKFTNKDKIKKHH